MRALARRIPNNAALVNILNGLERPIRADFYRAVKPHLRFVPISLEVFNNGVIS